MERYAPLCSLPDPRIHFVAAGRTPAQGSRSARQVPHPPRILKNFRRQLHRFGRIETAPALEVHVSTTKKAVHANLAFLDPVGQFPRRPHLWSHDAGIDTPSFTVSGVSRPLQPLRYTSRQQKKPSTPTLRFLILSANSRAARTCGVTTQE